MFKRLNWMKFKESNSRQYREIKRWCTDTMEKLNQKPEMNDLSDLFNRQSIKVKVKKVSSFLYSPYYAYLKVTFIINFFFLLLRTSICLV